jgi:hypothetical protein
VFTVSPPLNTVAGAAITPAVQVTARDSLGNTVTSFTGQVTVAISTNPSGGVLSGITVRPAVAGVAGFPGLSIDRAGTGYTLVATSTGTTPGTSASFNILGGPATSLVFTQQPPASVTAGQTFSPAVAVTARDQFGNTATGFTSTVNLAIGNNPPPGGGVLDGTTSVAAVAGVATFSAIDIDEARNGFTLVASSGALNVTSNPFNVVPGPTTQLAFTVQPPASAVAGAALAPPIQVSARDANGNLTPAFTQTVTITIGNNPGGSTLSGNATVAAVGGIATFNNLSLNKTQTAYTLIAARAGLISDESTPFTITHAVANHLAFTGQPSNAVANVAIAPPIQVTVRDAFDNTATSYSGNVNLAIGTNPPPGTGALDGPVTVAPVAGVATFPSVDIDEAATGYTLTANSGSLAGATSSLFNITPGAATQLAISAGNNQTAPVGTAVAIDPAVLVRDAFNNPVPGVSVTFTVTGGGGSVVGSPAITNASGIATVTSWTLGTTAGPNSLQASAMGITPVTFNATATSGPVSANLSTVSAAPTTITASSGASQSTITVTARDGLGNPVSGATVVLAATGTGNTLTQPGLTNAAGVATGTLSSTVAEGKTVSATINGVGITQTATVTVTVGAVSASLSTVSAAPATITASNGASQSTITVTAKDAVGNPIVGATVVLAASGPGNTLTQPAATTNASGIATGTLSSTVAQAKTVSATINGVAITQTATVTVNAGAVSAAQSLVSAAPASITAGAGQSTITVTARDDFTNPISLATVVLAATGAGNTLSQPTGTTNGSGVATGTLSSTVAEPKTVSATINGVGVTQTATVTVTAAAVSQFGFTVQPSHAVAGALISPAVRVAAQDAFGNTVTSYGQNIRVDIGTNPSGGTLSGTQVVPPTAGVATFGDLSINSAGPGYTLVASRQMGGGSPPTPATSAAFDITVGAVSGTQSTVVAGPSTITASNGSVTSTITVTARDGQGNPISGLTVALAATGTGNTLTQPTGTTNTSGVATGTLSSTVATVKTVSATISGVAITQTATVTVTPAAVSATQSAVATTPGAITASGGSSQSTITVTAHDQFANPIAGATVALSATGTGNTLTQPLGPTNAAGVATGTLSSTVAQGKTVSATINGVGITQTATVTVNPAPVSAAQSLVSAAPTTITASTGSSQSTITVTARDQFLNPINGATVVLASTGTGNTFTQPAGTTNASGVATGTFSSTVAQGKTVSATINGVGITQTATVTVNPAPVNAAQSLVSAAPTTITASTGSSQSTITVTARDQFNNPISGASVTLAATGTGNTVTQPVGPTNASGVATGTLSATVAGAKTVSATIGGTGITQTATVTVNPATVSAAQSLVSASPTTITADGSSQSTISVTARDEFDNAIGGATVVLAATGSGNTLTQPGGSTDASGVAIGTLSTIVAESKTVTATINGVAITQTATVTASP